MTTPTKRPGADSLQGALHAGTLEFTGRGLCPDTGRIRLHYRLGSLALEETLDLGGPVAIPRARAAAMEAALDLLHWIAGVSYFKAACPPVLAFGDRLPDAGQARSLDRIYREGLAEFAWVNDLDPDAWPEFPASGECRPAAGACGMARRSLVPLGGGKDSVVVLEALRAAGEPLTTVQVGESERIGLVAARAGTAHRVIRRRLAPELAELNRLGALNGHVPVTAINAAVLVVAALAWDADQVVFGNERSADQPTLVDAQGRGVNHQFAKSLAFERLFDAWVRGRVAADLRVFSLLRRHRELAVCRRFADLADFHDVFSSCNRNFHLDGPRTARWCGQCPKCHFVYLALAPFMTPERLQNLFGADLLADPAQAPGFEALLALDGAKPFECVGEAEEARAAAAALAADAAWRDHAVVRHLDQRLSGVPVQALAPLLAPGGDSLIPDRLADAL